MLRTAAVVCAALGLALASAGPAVAAPAWLPPVSPFGAGEGRMATATMSGDGTVTTAQLLPTAGTEAALEVRTRPAGGTFGPHELIDVGASTFVAPLLVSARDGGVAVVYGKSTGTWASIRPPAGSFGPPRLLSTVGGAIAETVALDVGGRLWFVHPQSTSFVASTLGPTGAATDSTIDTAPAGYSALSASVGLAPDGQLRVAYEFGTFPNLTEPFCTQDTVLREADGGAFGFGAPATLATASASGTGIGICTLLAGTKLSDAHLATTSDGATTVLYTLSELPAQNGTVLARHRAPGGAWPAAASPAEAVTTATLFPTLLITGAGPVPLAAIGASGSPSTVALSSRNPGGSWTAPQVVTGAAGGWFPQLVASPSGGAVLAWQQSSNPFRIEAVVRSPAGALSPTTPVSSAQDFFARLGGVGIDESGNAVVGWQTHLGSEATTGYHSLVAGYDGAGPRFTSLSVPASAVTGQSLGFGATAVDVWSPAGPPSWQFGDGGSAVSHGYGAPGSYTVAVTATDALGNATTEQRPLSVSAPAPAHGAPAAAPPARDTEPPQLTKVVLKPKKVRRGKAARLSFELSEAATVRVTIARRARGVKRGGKCVKAPAKAPRKGKACRRFVTVKTLGRRFGAGPGSLALPRGLRAGAYRLAAVASDAAGNASAPLSTTLRVVKPPRP